MPAVMKGERAPWASRGRKTRLLPAMTAICAMVAGSVAPADAAPSAATTAGSLVLRATDLPPQWAPSGQAGRCVNGGPDPNPQEPYCGNGPFPGQQATDDEFARCVGVPVARLSLLTGVDQPGEPFTYSSPTYTAPRPKAWEVPTMFKAAPSDALPQVQSLLMMEPSAAVQRSDLQHFSNTDFLRCYKIELSSPTFALVKLFLEHEGYEATFTDPKRVAVVSLKDVATVGYDFQLLFTSQTKPKASFYFRFVIMGANGIEEVLRFTSSSLVPLAPNVANQVIARLEGRLARDLPVSHAST